MKPRRRRILLAMASSAALLVSAGPVSAAHTPEHATEEIAGIVGQEREDIDDIVSGLVADISRLSDEAAVGEAADEAVAAVESIWATARTAVDEVTAFYPGDLGLVGGDAKQQLQEARQTARSTISDLIEAWTPTAPVTTTITTATTPATEGAGAGAGANSGNGPGSYSDRVTDIPEGGGLDPGRPPESSSPPLGGSGPQEVQSSAMVLELTALTPDQPFTVNPEAITSLLAAHDTGATATMAAMLDTVLSPAVVDLVLSPLLVLEILLRTLVDGGLRLIGPLTLFAVCAMALFAYDRFSERNLILNRA